MFIIGNETGELTDKMWVIKGKSKNPRIQTQRKQGNLPRTHAGDYTAVSYTGNPAGTETGKQKRRGRETPDWSRQTETMGDRNETHRQRRKAEAFTRDSTTRVSQGQARSATGKQSKDKW